jgi:fucose 4-O-acetylase-like acetyltransferase
MNFTDKIKQPLFWKNFAKIAVPFFIVVTLISLLIESSSAIFSGDFETVNRENFANGKWKTFFGFKVVFTGIYAMYITNKNMK